MKATLSVTIDDDLNAALRAEADRQRRPLSWVVAETLRAGLKKHRRNGATAADDATVTQGAK